MQQGVKHTIKKNGSYFLTLTVAPKPRNQNKMKGLLTIILFILISSCFNNNKELTLNEGTDSLVTDTRIDNLSYKQTKRISPMRNGKSPEVGAVVVINHDTTVLIKMLLDSIIYNFDLERIDDNSFSIEKKRHILYFTSDSTMEIIYFGRDGASEYYEK